MSRTIRFNLNGRDVSAYVEPHHNLVELLQQFSLKGARESCGQGLCGCCTVNVNGEPVSGCLYFAVRLDGKRVTTVEHLDATGALTPVQQCFIDHGAFQCGFCTSGFILMSEDLLKRNANPSDEAIRNHFAGNLCRCAAYPRNHRSRKSRCEDASRRRQERVQKRNHVMIMNSQHLEYFCKVAEFGSFSRAAIFLGINQSALSRHVRNLERDLGVQLFYRNGRGVVLTEFGKRLLVRAGRALEEIALAKQEAVNARTETIESVVIGMTPTVGRVLIQPLARELMTAFPNIKLRFMEGFSGHLLEWLDAGRLDLAVLYQGWSGGRLHAEHLITERLCLVSSKKAKKLKPKTPTAELKDVPLILPSAPHGLRRLVDLAAAEQKFPLKVVIEADSFESILALVKDNLGSTVLPAVSIQDELARQQLQASLLVRPEVTRTLILATPTNRPPVRGLTQISKTIKRELKRLESV